MEKVSWADKPPCPGRLMGWQFQDAGKAEINGLNCCLAPRAPWRSSKGVCMDSDFRIHFDAKIQQQGEFWNLVTLMVVPRNFSPRPLLLWQVQEGDFIITADQPLGWVCTIPILAPYKHLGRFPLDCLLVRVAIYFM